MSTTLFMEMTPHESRRVWLAQPPIRSSRPAVENRKPPDGWGNPSLGCRAIVVMRASAAAISSAPVENPQHDVIGAAFVVIQPDHLASLTGSAIAENVTRRRF